MLLFHIFENSNRNEFLIKQYGEQLIARANQDHSYKGEKTPEAIVDQLLTGDPQNGKNLNAIIKWYIFDKNKGKRGDDIDRGPFMMEDIKSKVLESLKTFFKFKSKIEIKDLGRYPSIQDLWEVTDAFAGETETLSKSQMEKVIKKDTKKLIDTPDFKVYVPETKESACYYGKGTKWCTAADNDNMFDHYNSQGKLYVIMAGTGENIKKFQLHFESEQFMNDKDAEITKAQIKYLSGFPKYKEFLEMLIEEHYGDALKAYDKLKAEGKIK